MSKTFATATLTIRQDDTYELIQGIIDNLEDEYGCDAMECAGVDQQELFDAILQDATFKTEVVKGVQEEGMVYLTECYDYVDFEYFLRKIPGLSRVVDLVVEADQRLCESAAPTNAMLVAAMETVKAAGFRVR